MTSPVGSRLIRTARDNRAAGVTMTVATAVALLWANAAAGSYRDTWHHEFAVPGLRLSTQEWVNQGLMVAFFVVIGLEIRREIAGGELRSWRRAVGPTAAAIGGMVVPALLYAAVVHGRAGSRGWGIPMATDVAFALGALALVSAGASTRLRVFLLTLAVVDDIACIAILVCFYSNDVKLWNLVDAVAAVAAMVVLYVLRKRATGPLIVLGAIAWWALVHAGVEASVVGVAIGLLLPSRWEHHLEPWVNALVLPLFALANAGVKIVGSQIFSGPALAVFIAVFVARVIGKPLGIAGTVSVMSRNPDRDGGMRLRRRERVGVGALASVGFTVPLLIVHAALPAGPLAAAAICALLAGSVLGALSGAVVLRVPR